MVTALAFGACIAFVGCPILGTPPLRPELQAAATKEDALALSDELEKLIDAQEDAKADREAAYAAVREFRQSTAGYAFARAALAGRLAQIKGLRGGHLIAETERWARISIGLNPKFRNGAARRMLGIVYVLAPASLLKYGDSEKGVELLERLRDEYPADIDNYLYLAEAYVSLDDHESAQAPLCKCIVEQKKMRPSSRRVLAKLLETVGRANLQCDDGAGSPRRPVPEPPTSVTAPVPPPPKVPPQDQSADGGAGPDAKPDAGSPP